MTNIDKIIKGDGDMKFNVELLKDQYVLDEFEIDVVGTTAPPNYYIVVGKCVDAKGNVAYSTCIEVDGMADVMGNTEYFETYQQATNNIEEML